jgi:F-type H+-transporting ATPase subunit b
MHTSLLLLAAAAEPAEAASGITKIVNDLGIDVPSFVAQMLSFGIVAFVLWQFGFKPVLATLDERQQKIDSGLKYAEEMKAKLEAAQQESAAILKKASQDAGRIVDEARKTAKEAHDKQAQETAAKIADQLAKGQQAIELEHKKMLAEARGEIARLVVVTTERVLAKKLSDADRAAYNESAARELAGV